MERSDELSGAARISGTKPILKTISNGHRKIFHSLK